jgi:hypothetical protein
MADRGAWRDALTRANIVIPAKVGTQCYSHPPAKADRAAAEDANP